VLHGFDTHYKELIEAQERAPRDIGRIRTGIAAAGMQSSTASPGGRARSSGRSSPASA
jgi:hypothetical protein